MSWLCGLDKLDGCLHIQDGEGGGGKRAKKGSKSGTRAQKLDSAGGQEGLGAAFVSAATLPR